ncbi:MAG: hypothetical protein GX613_15610 [Chloroflexi bacterium]|nr:hypothetical protein [Chloroflexota bacterium]
MAQSAFYVFTGIWPLVSPPTFQAITGPKVDFWLVKTAGALITAIGAALGLGAVKRRVTPELKLLGIASAAGLAAIDVYYVAQKRISPVYLLDAAAEAALIAAWIAVERMERDESRSERVSGA